MNIINWLKRKKKVQIEKPPLRLEIENLESELRIYNCYNYYLYESREYLEKLKESKIKVDYLLKKYPDIAIFLQDPSHIFIIKDIDYDPLEEYSLIDFDELEKEIIKDNNSRDIILEDLEKLKRKKIEYKDIHFENIQYINSDFSCFLDSIISKLIGKKIKLPEYRELKYSQFYINNYRIKDLDNFPRIGPIWKRN